MAKKIVIVGPESTGKSTLSEKLANHFGTVWVPEYAREYLLKHGMTYTKEDLRIIAEGQIASEDKLEKAAKNNLLFIDTNMVVMKVWCEYVFNNCDQYILEQLNKRHYDLYLLCNTDLPWVKDELREYPDLETRQKLYEVYKNILQTQTVPWVEIKGQTEERFRTAVYAVEELLR